LKNAVGPTVPGGKDEIVLTPKLALSSIANAALHMKESERNSLINALTEGSTTVQMLQIMDNSQLLLRRHRIDTDSASVLESTNAAIKKSEALLALVNEKERKITSVGN